ncbi:MAG: hypothetical protein LUC37_00975 [Prevotella sp.]|nr:hypothetical protein [Prevotella sp.]
MLRNQMSPKSYNIGYYYDFEEGYSGVDIRIIYKSWVADNINTQEHFEYVSQDSFDDA